MKSSGRRLLGSLISLTLSGVGRASEPALPPHVLLFVVDDMGLGDSRVYNPDAALALPHLERLAAQGVRFTRAHATAALCSPSRYSILTGNYPFRSAAPWGVWSSFEPRTMVRPGQLTMAQMLRDAGYQTAMFGKLHHGGVFAHRGGGEPAREHDHVDYTRPFQRGPAWLGFASSLVLPMGLQGPPRAYFLDGRLVRRSRPDAPWEPFADNDAAHAAFVRLTEPGPLNGGWAGRGAAIMDFDSRQAGPQLAQAALEFLDQRDRTRPFFLYFAATSGHVPHTPPEKLLGHAVRGASGVSARLDMIHEADVILGLLLDRLRRQECLDRTLVVFTSDNGVAQLGTWDGETGSRREVSPDGSRVHLHGQGIERRARPDGESVVVPLRGEKSSIYEGGHRVPLVLRLGDRLAAGAVRDQRVGLQDLMATVASLAGITLPADQARDSLDLTLLLGESPEAAPRRDHLIVQGGSPVQGQRSRAFYQGAWKLIFTVGEERVRRGNEPRELYHLERDPGETRDRRSEPDQGDRVRAMRESFEGLLRARRTVP